MAVRTKALIEPALLVWARTTASLELEEAAEAIGVSVERLEDWEQGSDKPTIPQLKKAAAVYKRPLSVLFLPEPPTDFMPLRDFHGSRRRERGAIAALSRLRSGPHKSGARPPSTLSKWSVMRPGL